MRRITRATLVAAVAFGLTGGFAVSANAAVADKKSAKKFCTRLYKTQTDPDLQDTSDLQGSAEKLSDLYEKASKLAPTKKLRKAAETIADYYDRLSGIEDFSSSEANYTDDETDAIATISTYAATKCLKYLPTTTLPGG